MKKIIAKSRKYGAKIVLVDDENYDELNKFKWHVIKGKKTFYVVRTTYKTSGPKRIWMHREILNLTDREIFADHIDGDGLNQQKSNLRAATCAQNCANRTPHFNSTSKYLGVCWQKDCKKWRASISKRGEMKYLGLFRSETDAAKKYNEWAIKLHGEFANLNKIAS